MFACMSKKDEDKCGGDGCRRERNVGDNEHADSRDGGDALAGFQLPLGANSDAWTRGIA